MATAPSATTTASTPRSQRGEPAQALVSMRARLGLVGLLLGLTAAAWWSTADRMAGMDAGPGTDLGPLGWFLGVWSVMMAAMMLPSLAPTAALYARMTRRRGPIRPLLFSSGYLVVWTLAGVLAYSAFRLGRDVLGSQLAWDAGGRWFAGGVLALAALYELTPLKHVCLARCRSPLAFLLGSWRDGPLGALRMGARHAVWCLGCCAALMVALFALGVMSLGWMALVAALIALEKTLPWRRLAVYGTAGLMLVLAISVATVPHDVPGLVTPAGSSPHGASSTMGAMGSSQPVHR